MSDPVDIHVGRRLKEARDAKGLSQDDLGSILGISFQQIQKYEKGVNRIAASRLYHICRALDVQPTYFFEGFGQSADDTEDASPRLASRQLRTDDISDKRVRRAVKNLIAAISDTGE